MRKHFSKIIAMLLVVITLVSLCVVPAAAAGSYPMNCSIYYKDESGKTVATTKTFSMNAADTTAQQTKYYSPSVSGYALKYSSDSYVTYAMMDKSFPASHYVRQGSATYTVYYVKTASSTITYQYEDRSGTAAPTKTVTGKEGASFTVTSPTVTGYTPNRSSVSGTYGDGNHSVYYYEKSYTVSYNANGGSGAPSSQTKWHTTNLTLSSTRPTRTGYTFQGWGTSSSSTTASYQPGGTYSSNTSRTLYAVWQLNKYTVSYNANGGSGAPSSQTKAYGLDLTLSSTTPTRSGYTFKGWGTSSSSTTASYQPGGTYTSNSSRTLYAIWESNAPTTYTVSYNANGGSGAPASQTKTHGVTLTLSSTKPSRSGYTFLGWSTSSSAKTASYSAGGSYTTNASCTMYAVWSCSHSSTSQSYVTGCDWERTCNNCGVVTATGTTHGPYSYGSWTYYSTSQHRRYKDCDYGDYSTYEYGSHSKTTEYEQYSSTQHKYYSYCSTCASMIGSASYEAHDFSSTTSGGKTVSVCNDCGYTKETVQNYTVSYNANGGSGAPSSQTKTYGVTLTLSSVVPTRSGYTFMGWGTSSSSTSASYSAGGSYTNNASITLYAIWSCPHSSASQSYVTGCDWQRVCDTCGTVLSTGTTHGPYTYSAWEYYSTTQHVRYKNCDHGDYSEAQYQGHSLETKFEQYTASQHKYYSYCSECDNMVGNSNTEAHSFTSTESNGNIIYTCSECGYSYSVKKTYTVSYNANGGINPPSSQTKIHGETLTLSSSVPTRDGYDFKGWSTSSSATSATYAAGGSYTSNASTTLYAVWEKTIFTVSYNANGGSGAPASQTKTIGQSVTISTVQPTRTNHAFMGWATSSTATSPEYYGGETYYADASVTLYAVWVERNYDFSVSNLSTTPAEVYQYEKISILFRTDSWDRNLPYDDIPVEVLLNGSVIYSTTVDFIKYGVQNFSFDLNVGALLGQQNLEVRVNWADHTNETRTNNNSATTTFNVKKLIETSTESVAVTGEYVEGFDVISSFYVTNEASSDIIPSDGVSSDFVVYSMNGSSTNVVSQQTWESVVIPAGGRNLVYFKWRVPAGSAGTTYFCKGTINPGRMANETNGANNTTEYAVLAQSIGSSQTPNTHFESSAPSSYNPAITAPTAKSGSATWNMWVYENGSIVLKNYGVSVSSADPDLLPSSACLTAEKVGNTWKMRSGYGVTVSWNPKLAARSGYTMPGADAYTSAQCVYATFPEYSYSTASDRYRTLEQFSGNYQFVQNTDADGNARVHFIPVYVEDGNYTVSVTATHIWTPAGMISAVRNVKVTIDGTIYDDWYQG